MTVTANSLTVLAEDAGFHENSLFSMTEIKENNSTTLSAVENEL